MLPYIRNVFGRALNTERKIVFPLLALEHMLGGQWFESDLELKTASVNWFNFQAVNFHADGLKTILQCLKLVVGR